VNDESPGTDDPPGTTTTAGANLANERVNVSARLEGDADGDGFGDESQDACLGLPGSVAGCPRADLALTDTASHGTESDLVTYTLTATNNGPDGVGDPAVAATLPVGAVFVSSTGGSCSLGGRVVTCPVVAMGPGASRVFTITARLRSGNGQISTAAIASAQLARAGASAAGAGDPNPANNTARTTVNVVAPMVSSAKVVPSTFRLGSLLPKLSRRVPVGTTISFKLSEPSRATLTFSQPKTGRKVGRRCKPVTRANRRKPRCTIPNVRGTLVFNAHAGMNRVRFQGRPSRTKRLKPGRYLLTITARDSAGNPSRPRTTGFTIVR
jgi:uncharacterized repeat protein (TIGR01451 family)